MMRNTFILRLWSALLATGLIFAAIASGQAPAKRTASADSVPVFWEKFKAAVIKNDKQTVAALSEFPISMGYGMRDLKTRAQLIKHFRVVFFDETDAAKCFPKAKPMVDKTRPKEFTIGCAFRSDDGGGGDPFVYTFVLTRKGWRFAGFENINE